MKLKPSVQKKCNRPLCWVCNYLLERHEFHLKDGLKLKIKNDISCDSDNLTYIITCKCCHENYIGQTGQLLRQMMTVHRQQIRDANTRKIPLANIKKNEEDYVCRNLVSYHSNSVTTEQLNKGA